MRRNAAGYSRLAPSASPINFLRGFQTCPEIVFSIACICSIDFGSVGSSIFPPSIFLFMPAGSMFAATTRSTLSFFRAFHSSQSKCAKISFSLLLTLSSNRDDPPSSLLHSAWTLRHALSP
ncbi:unnamed protein product [Ectocarpus sp. 12 AP-2014]